jgi:hypothetical protein
LPTPVTTRARTGCSERNFFSKFRSRKNGDAPRRSAVAANAELGVEFAVALLTLRIRRIFRQVFGISAAVG